MLTERPQTEGPKPAGRGRASRSSSIATPLVLDLDGTLIATDILYESLLLFVRANPLNLFRALAWVFKGRAHLKHKLAQAVDLDVGRLPLREDVVSYAQAQVAGGREAYIATASDVDVAARLRGRLPFISGVIGSDGVVNLKSKAKAAALTARFPGGFTYVGDAPADLAVWAQASEAVFAGRSRALRRKLEQTKGPVLALPAKRTGLRDWAKALRLHQWAKNGLIFAPILLGGRILSAPAWIACLLGFLGMGCVASATYVLNDLIDLNDDRGHWSKRERAFASGKISIPVGLGVIPFGLIVGLGLAYAAAGTPAVLMLGAYLAATLGYSFGFKRVAILDVAVLAGLFTMRLAIGVVCAGVAWSAWLLVFSMFVFGSLSFAKRATEISRLKAKGGDRLPGRGYIAADEMVVVATGVSLASAAVFVMVMYLIQVAFHAEFYREPRLLWAFPGVLALWLGRIWLLCGRGELDDDPVVFAVRDKISLALGAVIALALAAAIAL
jgi:4-hydroxybenzoate polyprenyltransferase